MISQTVRVPKNLKIVVDLLGDGALTLPKSTIFGLIFCIKDYINVNLSVSEGSKTG